MMFCLQNIVGVYKDDCPCILEGLTTEQQTLMKASTSGLFITDLPGGVSLKALDYADDCANLAQIALKERDNAIAALEQDLIIALNNQYKKSKPNFDGQIGRMAYTQNLNVNGQFQGIRLRPSDYGDGIMTLKRVTMIVNNSATFPVYLYRTFSGGKEGTLLNQFNITTTGGNYSSVDIASPNGLKLPLTYNGESVDYYLIYDRQEANGSVPKDNGYECCGQLANRSKFILANGVQYNDLSNFVQTTPDNYAHGFILDVTIKCDNEQLFCREYKADDAVAVVMAHAVRFKAAALLIDRVLSSTEVNRYTMMDRGFYENHKAKFNLEYESRIEHLAATLDVTSSHCYICSAQGNQPYYSGILA